MEILELVKDYDSTSNPPGRHGQFIDHKNEKLYIFGGFGGSFITFDLNKKVMVEEEDNDDYNQEIRDIPHFPRSVNVSSPSKNDKVHILTKDAKHFTFDCKEILSPFFLKFGSETLIYIFFHGFYSNYCQ